MTCCIRAIGCLLAVTAGLAVCACEWRYQAAGDIKNATVPPGDTAPPLSDPVTGPQSLRFGWEFDSHLDASQYLAWAVEQLPHRGFAVQQRGSNAIALTRLDGGDAYRMRIEIVGQSPTHVRITLTVSPD
jgi:hypothetical protein